jgi:dTDP-4-dehydrorhamnose 3,5-epimerase
MNIAPTSINDVLIIEPDVFEDKRGYFMEIYHPKRYRECGIWTDFVQDNLSFSVQSTLRGLHYQINQPQAKLVQVLVGRVFDVAVDIRYRSGTFGKWTAAYLSEENKRQMLIPEGFAHGFCVLSSTALVLYKCSDLYDPLNEGGILWCDPDIGIDWPVKDPIVSEKDRKNLCLSDLSPAKLPLQAK